MGEKNQSKSKTHIRAFLWDAQSESPENGESSPGRRVCNFNQQVLVLMLLNLQMETIRLSTAIRAEFTFLFEECQPG